MTSSPGSASRGAAQRLAQRVVAGDLAAAPGLELLDVHVDPANGTPIASRIARRCGEHFERRAQISSSGNQMPISRVADSVESEPWTMFWPTATAKSPRIEPVLASSGLVAPMSWRAAVTAWSPSSTIATSGALVMKSTSSPKKGRSSCSS